MARKKFQFGAQPALDKALAHQESCEVVLAGALRAVKTEAQKLARIQEGIEQTRQQIGGEHDKLAGAVESGTMNANVTQWHRYIESLETRLRQQREAAGVQEQQVRWARQQVVVRREELNEAVGAALALAKYKERLQSEHQRALRKAEQREQDDDTAMRYEPPEL